MFSPCSADALYFFFFEGEQHWVVFAYKMNVGGCGFYTVLTQDQNLLIYNWRNAFVSDITASSENVIWEPSWAALGSSRMYCSEAQLDLESQFYC